MTTATAGERGPRPGLACCAAGLPRPGRDYRGFAGVGYARHPRAGQGGFTLLGWLFILILLGIAVMLVLRAGPVYMEQWTVRSIVDDVAGNPELADADASDVRRGVRRRMQVNSISDAPRDALVVERKGEAIVVVVDYERRFPLVANLDGVASFRNEATVGQ